MSRHVVPHRSASWCLALRRRTAKSLRLSSSTTTTTTTTTTAHAAPRPGSWLSRGGVPRGESRPSLQLLRSSCASRGFPLSHAAGAGPASRPPPGRAISSGGSSSGSPSAVSVADEEAPATTASSSPEIVVVDHVSEENGFFVVKGASHTTPDGSLLADEATGRAVAFVAYNMKDMDPTELRAVALPLGDGDDDDGLLGDGAVGRRLILDETRVARAPKARDVFGKVVNYLGIPLSEISGGAAGDAEAAAEASEGVAIFNDYPGVDDRESIDRNFHTGIKAVDALVPVGVGQSMLIMGKRGTRKTTMALDMVLAAAMAAPSPPSSDREDGEDAPGGFAFVYSCSSREAPRVLRAVEAAGLADRATVVVREDAMSRGRRHVGLLTALAIAEDLRDQGRDAVVFLDDLAPSVRFWEDLCRAEVRMSEEERQELMEVDGMLIARFDALQRQFFSNLLQRSARMSAKLGWGSLTLFGLLQGEPMREDREDLGVKILKHQNLSPEMREKLLMALASRVADAGDGGAEGGGEGEEAVVSTRTVEEFKSISDGHILMCDTNADSSRRGSYDIVSALSTTRLGVGRVAAKEIMALCSSLQLRLQQTMDARAFGDMGQASTSEQSRTSGEVERLLTQEAGRPVSLGDLREQLRRVLAPEEEEGEGE